MDQTFEQKDYRTLANFRYQLRQYLHFSEQAAYSVGLTAQRYTALIYLVGLTDESDEMTVGQLAELLLVKHHSAGELVDRMEADGLVIRVPSKRDHRQVCVEITAKGKDLLDRLASIHKEELQRIGPQLRNLLRSWSG